MNSNPSINLAININNLIYIYSEHPSAIGRPYGQEGRRATVYQLQAGNGGLAALKVFKPRFRVPRMVAVAEKLAPYAALPGLYACRRTVISSKRNAELLAQHPELTYAVLMPWIEGKTWQENILTKQALIRDETLAISRSLANIMVDLEENGLAHCDLSGPNIIVGPEHNVDLVDLEEMYGPGFLQPDELPAGSSGYAHHSVINGDWNAYADRFSGAVILAEMLGWCDERIRNLAWGESYFDPGEMQKDCERYRALKNVLQERWGSRIAELYEQAWQSDGLRDCPTFSEWHVALVHGVEDVGSASEVGAQNEQAKPEPVSYFAESGDSEKTSDKITSSEESVFFNGTRNSAENGLDEKTPAGEWQCAHCGKMVAESQSICPWCEHSRTETVVQIETTEPGKPASSRSSIWPWVILAVIVLIIGMIWISRRSPLTGNVTVSSQNDVGNPFPSSSSLGLVGGGTGKLVFFSSRGGDDEIYTINTDGSGLIRLTDRPGYDKSPSWSPTGEEMAFTRDFNIWIMNSVGGNERPVIEYVGNNYVGGWSPDGTMIAYHSDRNGQTDIYVINQDGSNDRQITVDASTDTCPRWSLDGQKLLYWSSVDGGSLYEINIDGSNPRMIVNGVAYGCADWSPDNQFIVYGANDGLLHTVNVDGTGQVQLLSIGGRDGNPMWSPDGKWIVYNSMFYNSVDIFLLNTETGQNYRLTDDPENEEAPDWQP